MPQPELQQPGQSAWLEPAGWLVRSLHSSHLLLVWVVACYLLSSNLVAEDLQQLRLKSDIGFSAGRIVPAQQPGQLGWQAEGLAEPLLFDLNAVRSVLVGASEQEDAPKPESGAYFFQMRGGGLVTGDLLAIDDRWVTVNSPLLGQLDLHRSSVLTITDAGYAGQLVYAGPSDDGRWVGLGDEKLWEFEAGALIAKQQRATIVGQIDIPDKAEVRIGLSWAGAPDFVVSLATQFSDRSARVDQVESAARLEVWDQELALVRETDSGADIAMLSNLSDADRRIELSIYLNQTAGTVIVCDSHGRQLESLTVPANEPRIGSAIHLANHGPMLSIEQLEVRQWDGLTTGLNAEGETYLLDKEGQLRECAVTGFDAESGELQLQDADNGAISIAISSIRRADLLPVQPPSDDMNASESPESAENADVGSADGEVADSEEAEASATGGGDAAAGNEVPEKDEASDVAREFDSLFGEDDQPEPKKIGADAPTLEVVLSDRSRLRGHWLAADSHQLQLDAEGLRRPVSFLPKTVVGLIGSSERFAPDLLTHKNGTLKLPLAQLAGYLEQTSAATGSAALRWHPHGAFNAAAIKQEQSGAIVYRKQLPRQPITAQTDGNVRGLRVVPPAIFQRRRASVTPQAQQDRTARVTGKAGEIMFRTGDAIDGTLTEITEAGVTFQSEQTSATRAEHKQIQHVWLNKVRSYDDDPKKLARLMTVPRSSKTDPPTHLLVSTTGDYLRGRLVSMDSEIIVMEVLFEMIEIPTAKVGQIIWLHDRAWDENSDEKEVGEPPEPKTSAPFQVHVIRSGGRGLTFKPQKMKDNTLTGHSDLLGECSIALANVYQLLFGHDISIQVRAYRDDPWTLSLAQSPRVFMDGAADTTSAGVSSPLVGMAAPDFGLDILDGDRFQLQKHRDRIVVLDFWASWCGPCVQTMPLIEAAVNEIGRDKVNLVAVNIQEPAARVKAALQRLEIDATCLLDVDGEVAAAYSAQAIPQTVIIDRDGKVTHLFVGGGNRMVGQFKAALKQLTSDDQTSLETE